jgi:hypothetical protein
MGGLGSPESLAQGMFRGRQLFSELLVLGFAAPETEDARKKKTSIALGSEAFHNSGVSVPHLSQENWGNLYEGHG